MGRGLPGGRGLSHEFERLVLLILLLRVSAGSLSYSEKVRQMENSPVVQILQITRFS